MLDGIGELPMINVSWDDASAFCHWSGGGLPSEAEWKKAAYRSKHVPTKRRVYLGVRCAQDVMDVKDSK